MPTRTRIIFVSILILLGGALFSYCVFFYPVDITAQVRGDSATVSALKAAPVKNTSTSTVQADKSSQINQSSSQCKSPPKAGSI